MLEEFGKRDAIKMLIGTQVKIVQFLEKYSRTNRKTHLLKMYATCEFSIQALRREVEGVFTMTQMKRIDDLIEQERKKKCKK